MSWEHSSCRPELGMLDGTILLKGEGGKRVRGYGSAVAGVGVGDFKGGVVAIRDDEEAVVGLCGCENQ